MNSISESQLFLFGGSAPWFPTSNPLSWTDVDDRVRGGSSQSYLTPTSKASNHVFFQGNLNTTTLGGAGFASQTTTSDKVWDLSAYDGVEIDVGSGDGKLYTLILKDYVPSETREDGREKAGVSWEYDFRGGDGQGRKVWVAWEDMKATYRGREKPDAEPLKTAEVRRFSFMMRSFFGTQEGNFQVELKSISARSEKQSREGELLNSQSDPAGPEIWREKNENLGNGAHGWMQWLSGMCCA
ncbi:hypothetical protein MMC12_004445 [Toensbergia leucococca]|nr:hypothetical protein [Toensbergia leucococca]